MIKVSLKDVVGVGYKDFWNYRGRYRVLKGGRGSKKSVTTALNFIVRLMEHPDANLLVVRKVFKDHKDSTYAQLKWAINRLGVSHLWEAKLSPLEIIYKPTGQRIMFRGLDSPMSVTSIVVEKGYLSWASFNFLLKVNLSGRFNS